MLLFLLEEGASIRRNRLNSCFFGKAVVEKI